eukprot:SAG31_NODE_1360_length_8638_cov_55.988055_5_plen_192_part_00
MYELDDILATHKATGMRSMLGDLVHSCIGAVNMSQCLQAKNSDPKGMVQHGGIVNRDAPWVHSPCERHEHQHHDQGQLGVGSDTKMCKYRLLDPQWQDGVRRLASRLRPHIASGVVRGIFIGDELTCCSYAMPFSNLSALANSLRAALGPGQGLIYTNDGPGTISSSWPHIPPGLDLISYGEHCLFAYGGK